MGRVPARHVGRLMGDLNYILLRGDIYLAFLARAMCSIHALLPYIRRVGGKASVILRVNVSKGDYVNVYQDPFRSHPRDLLVSCVVDRLRPRRRKVLVKVLPCRLPDAIKETVICVWCSTFAGFPKTWRFVRRLQRLAHNFYRGNLFVVAEGCGSRLFRHCYFLLQMGAGQAGVGLANALVTGANGNTRSYGGPGREGVFGEADYDEWLAEYTPPVPGDLHRRNGMPGIG